MSTLGETLESDGYNLGIQRYDKDPEGGVNTHGSHLYKRYVLSLIDSLSTWLGSSCQAGRGANTKQFFRSTQEYHASLCAVAVRKAWKGAHLGNQVSSISNGVGQEVVTEYAYQQLCKEAPKWRSTMDHRLRSARAWEQAKIIKDSADKRAVELPRECAAIGAVLVSLMIEAGTFEIETVRDGRQCLTYLRFTEAAKKLMADRAEVLRLLSPVYPPMVEKPLPWTTVIGGGYRYALQDRLALVREGRVPMWYLDKLHAIREDLRPVLEAINAIQETPYRINKRVLNVVEVLEDSCNQRFGGMPPEFGLPEPECPPKGAPRVAFARWRLDKANIRETNAALESKRRAWVAQLSAARQWRSYPELYFPCTVDWRWRVYPVGTAINPQSDTLGKALLEFSEGKLLKSSDSIEMFKICGAGLFGFDKAPLEERVAWVDERRLDIVGWGSDPLDNLGWTEADEPLRFLAWCFAYCDWLDNKPIHFVTSVDGSQNGIQHYALLSRCSATAAQVNVAPTDKPNDLYSAVMRHVKEQVEAEIKADPLSTMSEKDAEESYRSANNLRVSLMAEDKPIPADVQAIWVSYKDTLVRRKLLRELDRSLVKRPVMTFSYSVTQYGITDQIQGELRQRDLDRNLQFDKHWIKDVAHYLTPRVLAGIHNAVSSAASVMSWFHRLAEGAVNDEGVVEWTTPMGVPIVQRYVKFDTLRVRTSTGELHLNSTTKNPTRTPDRRKAKSGIAPNIIHSFDAAHMQRTIGLAKGSGVTAFAMIHDSYGCHAEDLPLLARALRWAAVEIYSENQLERLRLELGGSEVYPIGDFDIKSLFESRYFFC